MKGMKVDVRMTVCLCMCDTKGVQVVSLSQFERNKRLHSVYSLTCTIWAIGYIGRNTTADQGTSSRALCRHAEQEKKTRSG